MWRIVYDSLEKKDIDIQSIDYVPGTILPHKFRLSDDDGEVYYEGFSSGNDDQAAFAPLDDYGMPSDGCTTIEYYDIATNTWSVL